MGSASPAVKTASDQDFQDTVLERSLAMPVLVDFWAPWCGPCKVIGPVLEKLAGEMPDQFELVKVNMDENPMLAQALMIRSIPAVKLFMNGEIKDEFVGAYPEPEVRRFLEHNLPPPAAKEAVEGLRMMQGGNKEDALQRFKAVLEKEPNNAPALLGMSRYHLEQGDLQSAKEVMQRINEIELDKLPDAKSINRELAMLQAHVYLLESSGQMEDAAKPELAMLFKSGAGKALQGAFQPALDDFLAVVKQDRKFQQDAGRKGMLAVFALLPPNSPLVDQYRAKLSSILFS